MDENLKQSGDYAANVNTASGSGKLTGTTDRDNSAGAQERELSTLQMLNTQLDFRLLQHGEALYQLGEVLAPALDQDQVKAFLEKNQASIRERDGDVRGRSEHSIKTQDFIDRITSLTEFINALRTSVEV